MCYSCHSANHGSSEEGNRKRKRIAKAIEMNSNWKPHIANCKSTKYFLKGQYQVRFWWFSVNPKHQIKALEELPWGWRSWDIQEWGRGRNFSLVRDGWWYHNPGQPSLKFEQEQRSAQSLLELQLNRGNGGWSRCGGGGGIGSCSSGDGGGGGSDDGGGCGCSGDRDVKLVEVVVMGEERMVGSGCEGLGKGSCVGWGFFFISKGREENNEKFRRSFKLLKTKKSISVDKGDKGDGWTSSRPSLFPTAKRRRPEKTALWVWSKCQSWTSTSRFFHAN